MTKTKTRLISAVIAVLVVAAALFLLLPTVLSTTASGEVWSGQAADSFATGEGTEENPYQIKTAEELAFMASKVNSGEANYPSAHYKLTADIVLNESLDGTPKEWTAIGDGTTPFTGKFDGDGHTISGIVINKSSKDYQGLFGYLGENGTIMKVGVIDSSISGSTWVGGVCGRNFNGTIENCYSTGAVSATGNSVGGVCGENYSGTIENCYSTGAVSGSTNAGGVCGKNGGTITNCYSTGAVSGSSNVGGVCGATNGGTIKNCYSTSAVSGESNVGGVCGLNEYDGTITSCYYDTDFCTAGGINGQDDEDNKATGISTAALCGSLDNLGFDSGVWTVGSAGDVTKTEGNHGKKNYTLPSLNGVGSAFTLEVNVYNFGTEDDPDWDTYTEISTAEELIALSNDSTKWSGNYVLTANITLTAPAEGESNWTAIGTEATRFTGKFDGNGHTISGIVINKPSEEYQGLFGYLGENATIMNVGVLDSSISGGKDVGGVCGRNENGTIENCYSTGTVSTAGYNVGGVCGKNVYGTIKNCYSTGEVSGSTWVGGVCGTNRGTIKYCYSTGAVSGIREYVGGVCGYNYNATITNCYSTGTVTGSGDYVGGVCGRNENGTIEYCYSTGAVSGTGCVGGVCGMNYHGTITNCYYDTDFYTGNAIGSDSGSATNVTGKTTADLCGSTLPAGFETSVWNVGSVGDVTETEGNYGKKIYTFPSLNGVGSAATYEEKYYNFGTDEAPDWKPYTEISTAEALQNINNNLGSNYVLTADITLTAPAEGGSNWTAIGTYSNPFTGKFDGDGHTISGIVINKSGEDCQGLFGCSAGTIMNVGVINSSISGSTDVGGVCGENRGTIKNCYSTGAVRGTNDHVGGVCGYNNGTIKNCYSTGEVSGSGWVGGVCGYNYLYKTIENCYSTGAVRGMSYRVGGVCGENADGGTITNCYYDTDFYTKKAIGNDQGKANNVTSKTTAALCGSLPAGFDSAVWTAGSITIDPEDGKKATATLPQPKVFENTSAPTTTLSFYNFGTDEAPDWDTYTEISTAEELKALSNDSTKWNGNYVLTADITLTAPAEAGGSNWTAIGNGTTKFTGKFSGDGHTISGIVINSTSDNQGLFGYSREGTIVNVGVIDSSISGGNSVGGVCGYNLCGTIKNCYSTGKVSGSTNVGGVCGSISFGTIENCYSTGTVSGSSNVGGVCGGSNLGTITNCYYLEGCNAVGTSFSCNEGTSKTETQFKNGSVCYLLNGSKSTNPVWYQLLETENYPNLDSTNSANRTVYQCTPCTVVFSNTEGQTAEHSCVVDTNDITKHICEKCGDIHDAVFTADDTTDTISVCCDLGSVTLKAPTENLTYDGTAMAATVEGELTGFDTPKILYKLKGSTEEAVETAPINAGTYVASITYTDADSNEHSVSVEYTIGKAELTVEADTYKVSKVYDGTTNAGAGNDGKFEISGLVGTDTVTITPTIGAYSSADVGTSNVTVTISITDASGNYTLGNTSVSVPAEITAKTITPTVEGSGTHTYTGSAITPNVTVKDGETVLVEDKDYTITVTNNINAGVATVTITAKSGGNYTFSEQTRYFQIFKATPKVTAPTAKTGLVYNGTAKELISAGSTDFGTLLYSLDGTNYSKNVPTATNTGNYTVYYKVQGNANVNDAAANTVAVSIGKAAVTITANSYTVKVGKALPTFDYTVSGLVNNEDLPIDVNVSCTAAGSSTAGEYPITVSGEDESANYTFTYVDGTLTITLKDIQTITAADVTLTYGNTGKKIGATTNGEGAITYSVKTGNDVIRVDENGTITVLKVGVATVEITAAETDGYAKAVKTVTVTVNKAAVTITANSYTVKVGDPLPTFEYKVTGLANGETLTPEPEISCSAADTSTAGSYTITVKFNLTEDEKYIYTVQNGTLTVQKKSSGGTGGSSGGGSRPTTPTTTNPSIGGSSKSWSDVAADLGKLTTGSEATIELNGSTTVPVDVIKSIADKDNKVTFAIDSVFSWVVDGSKINTPAAADLTFVKTTSTKSNGLRGVEGTQFRINNTNIPTSLEIAFKSSHAGKFANLYENVDGKLTFVTCSKLGEDGKVILTNVTEKGDYVAMLCEFSDRPGDMDNDGIINPKDSFAVLKDFVGIEKGVNPLVADMNNDGFINPKDALIILKKYLEIE